ncbi:MAG: SDR family oxidoreductase [Candidatus Eisenbacteria bacterium]
MNAQSNASRGGERYALITGGSRGIGRAAALKFARNGIHVAFAFFSNRAKAEETTRDIEACGVRALPIRANMGNEEHIDKMFDRIQEEFGALDIFVSNAATGILRKTMEVSNKEWDRVMHINLRALFHCTKRAVPLMEGRSNGRIVSLTSMGSTRTIENYAAVGSSKAAIESLTRYLAVELKEKNITVNAVCAGIIDTDSLKLFPNRDSMLEHCRLHTPGHRVGTPEDIADVIWLLCSPEAEWIVGQTIIADGGYALRS